MCQKEENRVKNEARKPIIVIVAVILALYIIVNIFDEIASDGTAVNYATKSGMGSLAVQINEEFQIEDYAITFLIKNVNGNSEVEYEVINNESFDVQYYVESIYVNKCIVYDELRLINTVTGGNKALDSFNISGASSYGIRKIETLDLSLCIMKSDYSEHKTFAHIEIENGETHNFSPDFSSKILAYADDSFELYVVKSGNGLDRFEYLVHNKTEKWLEVDAINIAINGIMADNYVFITKCIPAGYCYTGATAGNTITLWSALADEIKEKGFDNVETISANLNVYTWEEGKTKHSYEIKNAEIYASKTE